MFIVNTHAVVTKCEEPPVFSRLMCFEGDGGTVACIRNRIIGEIAEDAVYYTCGTVDDDILRSFVNEFHILLLQLEGGFLYYLSYRHRHVDLLELHHLTAIVHTVEHGDVVEQTGKAFALGIASVKELRFCLLLD